MSAFLPLAFAVPLILIDLTVLLAGVAVVGCAVFYMRARKRLRGLSTAKRSPG